MCVLLNEERSCSSCANNKRTCPKPQQYDGGPRSQSVTGWRRGNGTTRYRNRPSTGSGFGCAQEEEKCGSVLVSKHNGVEVLSQWSLTAVSVFYGPAATDPWKVLQGESNSALNTTRGVTSAPPAFLCTCFYLSWDHLVGFYRLCNNSKFVSLFIYFEGFSPPLSYESTLFWLAR